VARRYRASSLLFLRKGAVIKVVPLVECKRAFEWCGNR
jgi:hypothetical protein